MKKTALHSFIAILFLSLLFSNVEINAQTVNQNTSSYEEGESDIPPFAEGTISKEEYLRLRSQYFEAFHESAIDLPYNPRVKAIQEMEKQIQENANKLNKSGWAATGLWLG